MTSSPPSEASDARLEAFRPVHVPRASDEVLAVLADAIRGGLYRPGDRLPRQAELAARLKVSRHVVREAVEVLRRAGVVSVRRGQSGGITVRSTENLRQVLAGMHGETHANLHAILEARRAVELAAAPGAALHADEHDLARLRHLADALPALVDQPDEFLETDVAFHSEMVALARNPLLVEFHTRLLDKVTAATSSFPIGRLDPRTAIDHQQRTLAALRRGDRGEILAVLDAHLGAFEEVFLGEKLPFP